MNVDHFLGSTTQIIEKEACATSDEPTEDAEVIGRLQVGELNTLTALSNDALQTKFDSFMQNV